MKKYIILTLASLLMLTIACNEDQPTKITDYENLKSLSLYFWEDTEFVGDTINNLICSRLFYSKANPAWKDELSDSIALINFMITDTVYFYTIDTVNSNETYLFKVNGKYEVEFNENTAIINRK